MTQLQVLAPLAGTLTALEQVPDPVFSQGLVGGGAALIPNPGGTCTAVAPIEGTVVKLHPHAFVIAGQAAAVLVHLGLDTVKLGGEGFELLVSEQSKVSAGTPMITWNPEQIREQGYDPICPVVVLDTGREQVHLVASTGQELEVGSPMLQTN